MFLWLWSSLVNHRQGLREDYTCCCFLRRGWSCHWKAGPHTEHIFSCGSPLCCSSPGPWCPAPPPRCHWTTCSLSAQTDQDHQNTSSAYWANSADVMGDGGVFTWYLLCCVVLCCEVGTNSCVATVCSLALLAHQHGLSYSGLYTPHLLSPTLAWPG